MLPDAMKRAMAGQAEDRARAPSEDHQRGEGEFQAAEKLVQAAQMIAGQPIAAPVALLANNEGDFERA